MANKPSINVAAARSQTRATWIASVVAIIALAVSLLSLYEAHEARVASVRDELVLRAKSPGGNQVLVFQMASNRLPMLGGVTAPWDLLISNTGGGTISIISYEVIQIAVGKKQVQYFGLDRGLLSGDGKEPLTLPLIIEAGKSIRIVAMVGISPGKKAIAALMEVASQETFQRSVHNVGISLAGKGIDIFDNPVTPYVSDGEIVGWRVDSEDSEPVFMFVARTARGTEIKELSSWYGMKRY